MPEEAAKVASLELIPRTATLKPGPDPAFFGVEYKLKASNARGIPFVARVEIRVKDEDKAKAEAKAAWFSIQQGFAVFDFASDKTAEIMITARVPRSEAGKTVTFDVLFFERGSSDETTAKISADAVCPAVEVKKPTPLPRWLIPAIVAGVLVIGGVVFAIVKMGGTDLGDKCAADKDCPEKVACHQTKKQCLAKTGEACRKNEHCVTGSCGEGRKCAAVELGGACDPKEPMCAVNLECANQKCVGLLDVACEKPEECLSGKCEAKKCTALGLNATCDPKRTPSLCATGLVCPAGKCLAAVGSNCTQPADCVTNQCAGGKCTPGALKVGDACSGNCFAATLSCQGGVCKGNNGAACSATANCISGLECLSAVCQPNGLENDTNRLASDYRSFEMPTTDPQLCRQACISDTECKSFTYVRPNSGQGPQPRCWLKNAIPAATPHTCCVSGIVRGAAKTWLEVDPKYKLKYLEQLGAAPPPAAATGVSKIQLAPK